MSSYFKESSWQGQIGKERMGAPGASKIIADFITSKLK